MNNPYDEYTKFLTATFEAGNNWLKQAAKTGNPDASAGAGEPPTSAAAGVGAATQQLAELSQHQIAAVTHLWSTMLAGMPFAAKAADGAAPEDRRFAGEAWQKNPQFQPLVQVYQGYSTLLKDAIEKAPVNEKTKGQMEFAARQFLDAISPANSLATNPEAVQLAIDTGGRSLTDGMGHFSEDIIKGRISITDEKAFEVGKDLALTPGAVVFENELMQLIQYAPSSDRVGKRPLVIVPPCINRFYVLDLQPGNSLVRYAVEQGNTVFMVSWRNASSEMSGLTWDDYLERGVMKAIDAALEISGADRVNALGFCIGGALLASTLAVQKAKGEQKVASLTLMTTMLDYTDTGELGLLVTEEGVAKREREIGKGGVLEGKELGFVFSALRANDLVWRYVSDNYLKGKKPPAFDMLFWNADTTNLPGPMYCWYLRNTYLENNLRVPGKTVQCGVPVDLGKLTVPAYLYASRDDHIVPWQTAYESTHLLGGESTFVLGASGHIAGVVNPPSKNKRNYWVDGTTGGNAEQWLTTAKSVPGSWWTHWSGWLASHRGRQVPARGILGNNNYAVIEAAPGRYVKERVA